MTAPAVGLSLAVVAFDAADGTPRHFEVDLHPPVLDGHGRQHMTATVTGRDATSRWHRWHCYPCATASRVPHEGREDCDLDRAAHETGRDRP